MTHEQLATLLAVAEARSTRRDFTLLLTLADTGLRPGEALALQWEDVDAVDRTLRVERAVSLGQIKATKTEESRRVDLAPRLSEALSRWQAGDREAESLMRGRNPSQWIFPSEADTPLDVAAVAKRFRWLLRVAGLPRFRLYDLRHTYASHLLAEGAPITYVAAQLRHAKPTTTLQHYAHWLPRGDKQWVDRLATRRAETISTKPWHQTAPGTADELEVPDENGEPWRSRTSNLLIKSQLLCQLS